jgi:hypothetical protein
LDSPDFAEVLGLNPYFSSGLQFFGTLGFLLNFVIDSSFFGSAESYIKSVK